MTELDLAILDAVPRLRYFYRLTGIFEVFVFK